MIIMSLKFFRNELSRIFLLFNILSGYSTHCHGYIKVKMIIEKGCWVIIYSENDNIIRLLG
jgi:hypothetical protein